MTLSKHLLLSLVAFAFASMASAQQLETIYQSLDRPMSYQECVERSVFFDSNVSRQKVDSIARKVAYDAARNAYLPTLAASLREDWEYGRSQDNTGTYAERSSANTSFSVGMSYDVFTGLRRLSDVRNTQLEVAKSDANLAMLRERAELRVANFFYNLLLQEEIIRIAKVRIAQTERTLAQTRAFVEAGKWPSSKISEVEAQLEADKTSLIQAENNAAIVRVDLSVCVEYYGEKPLQLIAPNLDELLQKSRLMIVPAETIYKEALESRPDLKAANLGIDAAKEQIKSARAGYLPNLNFNAGYSNGYFRLLGKENQAYNKSFSEQLKHNGRFFLGFSLSVPLFDAFKTSEAIRRAKIGLASAELDKIDADLGLYKEIFKAHASAVAAERTITSASNAEQAARISAEAVRAAFEAGRSTTFELEQAENKLLVTQIDALRAKYDFILKAIHLDLYHR